jgi:hypothetical protein
MAKRSETRKPAGATVAISARQYPGLRMTDSALHEREKSNRGQRKNVKDHAGIEVHGISFRSEYKDAMTKRVRFRAF